MRLCIRAFSHRFRRSSVSVALNAARFGVGEIGLLTAVLGSSPSSEGLPNCRFFVRLPRVMGTMREGVRCRDDNGRLLHAHACDYIRSDRRGSRIEVQGARPGPGKLLCSREPCADELRTWLLAASAGADNDCDTHGAS